MCFIFGFGSFLEYTVEVSASRLLWRFTPGVAVFSFPHSGKSNPECFVPEQRSFVGTCKMGGSARVLPGCRGGNTGQPAAGFKMAFQSVKAMPKWKTKDRYGTLEMLYEPWVYLFSWKICIDLSKRCTSTLEKQVILVQDKTRMTLCSKTWSFLLPVHCTIKTCFCFCTCRPQ